MGLMQPLSYKYLNNEAYHPLHKYQQKISNSWQTSLMLPSKPPISPIMCVYFPIKWPKRDIVQPISCKYSNNTACILYTYINKKLTIIAKFSPYYPQKPHFVPKWSKGTSGNPRKYFNDTAHHLTAVSQSHFKVNYYTTTRYYYYYQSRSRSNRFKH